MPGQQHVSVPQRRDGASAANHARPSSKLKRRIDSHRPRYRTTERSWFVMLALVCFGMAIFITPALFVTLGVGSGALGWWRRESARQGVLNTAFVAFSAGVVLLLISIVLYIFQNL
jgi:ABC-type Fe3+ transport system permease subunit